MNDSRQIDAARALVETGRRMPLEALMRAAEEQTLQGFGRVVSYSRKVFIPLTQLCRDVCHYCTFAKTPRRIDAPYLSIEQVLTIARAGAAADCREALFTLGDKPELRYAQARDALAQLGFATTLEYLEAAARAVYAETGLFPHLNPGVMNREELRRLRGVAVSMGIMLESSADRLMQKGGPHFGSPDKLPAARLETIRLAGELAIPFTSGILIGIGETRAERIESLVALRDLHERYGHIQEIIIQNFRAKPGTKMAKMAEPDVEELQWTIAMARLTFGPDMSIQAPPNLMPGKLGTLIAAGVNDWGGVSPVTPDHVNPEAPWPHLKNLGDATRHGGRELVERLAITPRHALAAAAWVDATFVPAILRAVDAQGYRRADAWYAGAATPCPTDAPRSGRSSRAVESMLARAIGGEELSEHQIVALFQARGTDYDAIITAADALRARTVGDDVTFVVNRNINYTNICVYHCSFCAFSKGRSSRSLRGPAYNLDMDEIARRTVEAAAAGATEVCLQGGIHPDFTGETYLNIVATVKSAVPDMHVHAFSPLEIHHGATTLKLSLYDYLTRLKAAGLSTLPGTAAEVLDDEVRRIICPDKLDTREWLEVIETAHEVGLKTTSTIMFGHVDHYRHWARHLLHLRHLQLRTGGITEFVPLPFVHMESPMWRRGESRSGPTLREAVLMHAIARLALHPGITNIQTSWVKMGAAGAARCLQAGANDLGGTLMNESITRAAGGVNGQELDVASMARVAQSINRPLAQRSTVYGNIRPATASTLEAQHAKTWL